MKILLPKAAFMGLTLFAAIMVFQNCAEMKATQGTSGNSSSSMDSALASAGMTNTNIDPQSVVTWPPPNPPPPPPKPPVGQNLQCDQNGAVGMVDCHLVGFPSVVGGPLYPLFAADADTCSTFCAAYAPVSGSFCQFNPAKGTAQATCMYCPGGGTMEPKLGPLPAGSKSGYCSIKPMITNIVPANAISSVHKMPGSANYPTSCNGTAYRTQTSATMGNINVCASTFGAAGNSVVDDIQFITATYDPVGLEKYCPPNYQGVMVERTGPLTMKLLCAHYSLATQAVKYYTTLPGYSVAPFDQPPVHL